MFITFEGIDRSGKTTQAKLLANALGDEALLVREPGGTPAAERIRELVKDPGVELSPIAETLLFGAARAGLIEQVIRPALEAGRTVISDRYVDSTVAYQGGARGLPTGWPPTFPRPDITFLLEGPVETGLGRHEQAGKSKDRMERESVEFHRKVAEAYDRLAAAESSRFVRIDATGSRDKIHYGVRDRLKPLLEAR